MTQFNIDTLLEAVRASEKDPEPLAFVVPAEWLDDSEARAYLIENCNEGSMVYVIGRLDEPCIPLSQYLGAH